MRVIHYGLGPIGVEAARLVSAREGLEISGAVDIKPELVGRTVGDVVGVEAARDAMVVAELSEVEGDVAVHCTGSSLRRVLPQLLDLVRRGFDVVSTCEELSYPWVDSPDEARTLDDAAREHGVTVLGTGVNPGFVMDYLPLVMSGPMARVEHIAVHRVQEAGTRRLPLQQKVGAGMTVERFEELVAARGIGHVGLRESARLVAHAVGWELTSLTEELAPLVAKEAVSSSLMRVEAGQVSGIHQTVVGLAGDSEVISLVLDMGIGVDDPRDEVVVTGDSVLTGGSALRCVVPGGVDGDTATVAMVANALAVVAEAEPGLKTMAEVRPPVSCDRERVWPEISRDGR